MKAQNPAIKPQSAARKKAQRKAIGSHREDYDVEAKMT